MAESSRFWATNATGDGIGTGFTVTHWQNLILKLFEGGEEVNGAVLRGVGSALLCTGSASPITVPTGAAIGYGYFYENDANVTHAVTTPVVGTTGGHIVIETNWAAQTVRTKMYKNTDGIGTPPALTQTAGTLWQTRLCTFTITTGGAIALTDARALAHYSTEVTTAMLRDLNVTTAKLNDLAVTTAKLNDLAVTTAKVANDAITTAKLLDANVTAAKLAAGAVVAHLGYTPWHPGNDGAGSGLDADLLDGQSSAFYRAFANLTGSILTSQLGGIIPYADGARKGGNASDWSIAGTSTFTIAGIKFSFGVHSFGSVGAGTSSGTTITLPTTFTNKGIVIATFQGTSNDLIATGTFINTTTIEIGYSNKSAGAQTAIIQWIAIGPA